MEYDNEAGFKTYLHEDTSDKENSIIEFLDTTFE
jgi:hypothetical protein